MVHAQVTTKRSLLFLLLFLLSMATALAQDDPPRRVLRLNHMDGSVSMEPAGVDDWAPAVLNRPFYTGDYLYSDDNSRAELHTDNAAIRIGILSNLGVLNLTDTAVQLKLTQGDMEVTIHDLEQDQTFEVDTPNAAISFLRPGYYHVHVDVDQNTTWAVVRRGQAEVTGGGQAFTLNAGSKATMNGVDNQMSYDIESQPPPDPWDDWCASRDAHFNRPVHNVPTSMIGYEDLEDNGSWEGSSDYGQVWYPRTVAVGWAPYHAGHWAWVEPWGWTWVDDAPWGFAPFHYGRWVYFHERWGWTPGPMVVAEGYQGPPVRPCYAPAMVAWFGGAHFGVSVSIGGGAPSVGWVPLGWGEVYTPSYHVTPRYFSNVNVSNTRVVNNVNITNVYNTVYVNKTVYNQTFVNTRAPNAVMAMPQNALAGGRTVASAAVPLNTTQMAHFQPAQSTVTAPPVAPTRQALTPMVNANARPAPHPSAQALARPIVAKATPPPAPASFAARQSYLQQHAGQPLNTAEMRKVVKPAPQAQQVALVKQAPPAKPVVVTPGQHLGLQKSQVNVGNKGNPQQPPPGKPATPAAQVEPTAKVKPGQEATQPPKHGAPPTAATPKPGEPAAKPNVPGRPQPQETAPPPKHGAPPTNPAARPNVPGRPQPSNEPKPVERPAAPKPEAPRPAVERPAAPRPEAPKPAVARPAEPKPVERPAAPKPEAPKPAAPKPAVERPEAPRPAPEPPAAHGQPPTHKPAEPAARPPAEPKSPPPPAHKTSTKQEK